MYIQSSPYCFYRPENHIDAMQPEQPILYFKPTILNETLRTFQQGFDGLLTYAVKANMHISVLKTLMKGGIHGFDVASPKEITLLRGLDANIALHYNNPIRSKSEIECAVAHKVVSYSVDCQSELDKLCAQLPKSAEIAVRIKLPPSPSSTACLCDFGSKFGAEPSVAVGLLQQIASLGYQPAMTFHVGTQCTEVDAYRRYIQAAAAVASQARVRLARLNVGGGFPTYLDKDSPIDLADYFQVIHREVMREFGQDKPILVCEPGRSMVAQSVDLVLRIKAIRNDDDVFLNDGIYGQLAEWKLLGQHDRFRVYSPNSGQERKGQEGDIRGFRVFGPTCDSEDALNEQMYLPADIIEGDYIIFSAMGAYTNVTQTTFNGYGQAEWLELR